MAFDINGAREAGYSDAEIVGFLAPEKKFDAKAAKEAGYSDSEILLFLSQGEKQKPKEKEGVLRQAADVPVGVAKGAVQGVRMIADAFGAENPISKNLRGVEDYLGGLMSAQAKDDQQEIARIMKEAEDKGVLDQVKAGIKAFTVAPVDLLSQAFGTIAPVVVGGLAGGALRLGAAATGVATGSAMGAGSIKSNIYDAVKEELSKTNLPPDQIEKRAILAQEYGGQNLDQILLGAGIGGLSAVTGAEALLIPGMVKNIAAKAAAKSTTARALGTGVKEFGTEGLQGGQEQVAQNIALQREGYNVPTFRGAVGAGTMEGLAGFGMGTGVGAFSRPEVPREAPPARTPAAESVQEPVQVAAEEPAFVPQVIPPSTSLQEGIDLATGVAGGAGLTEADLLGAGEAAIQPGQRERAQALAAQQFGLNAPAPRQEYAPSYESPIAAQQAIDADRFRQQTVPPAVTPSQAIPRTPTQPLNAEQMRQRVDEQSALLAQAQNEPFEFDRRRLSTQADVAGGTGQVRGTPRAQLVDVNPMPPVVARQRLAVLKDELARNGQDPNSLFIVPHPTMGGRFAIEQRVTEQPYVAPPIEAPTVSAAEAQQRIESSALAGSERQRLGQDQGRQAMLSRIMRNIEERGGVASPDEAEALRQANMGRPYNRIDYGLARQGSVDERLTQATGLELARTPRETLARPATGEAAAEAQARAAVEERQRLNEQRRQLGLEQLAEDEQTAAFTARRAQEAEQRTAQQQQQEQYQQRQAELQNVFGNLPPGPRDVIAALSTPSVNRDAQQIKTVKLAQERMTPNDFSILEMVAENPNSMPNALQRIENDYKIKYSLSNDATPELKATVDDMRKQLLPILKRFGLEKVGLRLVGSIANGGADGMYAKQVITLALDSDNPLGVMRHEVIHALKELGAFTPAEWKVLSKAAKDTWINQFFNRDMQDRYQRVYLEQNGNLDGFQEYLQEEAIAQAFRFYSETKPPSGMIANLMRRLNEFFNALTNFLTGKGFTNIDDMFLPNRIFADIERGAITPGRAQGRTEELPKFSLRPEIKKIADNLNLSPEMIAATSYGMRTGKTGGEAFDKQSLKGIPETIAYLENRRLASGLPALDLAKDADRQVLADLLTAEVMAAIGVGKDAISWYDETINKTMAMAALEHPELKKDPNAQMAYKIAMAITSQTMNVEENIKFADQVYAQYKKNKRFPEIGTGKSGGSMVDNFKLANQLLDTMGADRLRQFLATPYTVGELRSAGLDITSENADEMVLGSSVLGPKIGFGFYSNLSGNFEPVTMDMWFMRLIGRLTGKLRAFDEKKLANQTKKLRSAFNARGTNGLYAGDFDPELIARADVDQDAAVELARVITKAHEKDYKNNRADFDSKKRVKTPLVNAAQAMLITVDKPLDAPVSGTQRQQLRKVVALTREKVAQLYGSDIPPASLQALVWYPEQELYKALGVKLRVTSQDYAGGIKKVLLSKGYNGTDIDRAAKQGSRAAQRVAQNVNGRKAKGAGKQSAAPLGKEDLLNVIRRENILAGKEIPAEARESFFNRPDVRAETYNITGEVIPSTVGNMSQVAGLKNKDKQSLNSTVLKQRMVQKLAESLGIKSIVRVKAGTGGYDQSISPNLIVNIVNKNPAQAKADADLLSDAMSYVFQQDATPYFRADPKLINTEQLGFKIALATPSPTATLESKVFKLLRDVLGNDAGYTKINNNEFFIINFGGENNAGFSRKMETFVNDLETLTPVSDKEVFGATSEYKFNDWSKPDTQKALASRVQASSGGQPNIQARLDDFRQSFVSLARDAVEKTGAEPKFSLRYFPAESSQSALRPSPSSNAGISFNPVKKDAVSFQGSHYGKAKTETLNGAKYGQGLRGAEARRLEQSDDERIKRRVYFYIPRSNDTMPNRETGVGGYVYTQKLDNILAPGATMSRLTREAGGDSNKFESLIVDNGYDGYAVPDYGMMVVLNQDVPVNYEGTVDEVHGGKKFSLRAPTTPEFKRFFGNSKVVNPDGTPKVMYHGTARVIDEFIPKQAGAVFVTDNPAFAGKFAEDSVNYMVLEQIDRLAASYAEMKPESQVKFLKKAYRLGAKNNDISKKIATAKIGTLDSDVESGRFADLSQAYFNEASEFLRDSIRKELESGENIMPLYVRAENPFDYENPAHINQVYNRLVSLLGEEFAIPKERLATGDWPAIEDDAVQTIIKDLGHDGFYVNEGGQRNLAVYNPNQIKSAIGNRGTFDESGNIRYSLKNAPPNRYTKLAENDPTAGEAITKVATSAFNAVRNDGTRTGARVNLVDRFAGVSKTLSPIPLFSDGVLRADMLHHAKAQGINLIKGGLVSGVPVLNGDGTIGIQISENNLARAAYLADKLDTNNNVVDSGLSGRSYVAEVARILRGLDIIEEDKATRALGERQIREAKRLSDELKAVIKQGGTNPRAITAAQNQIDKLRQMGNANRKVKRELQVKPEDIAWAQKQLQITPEIQEIFDIWKEVNTSLVNLWEAVGLLDKETADKYRAAKNYVPLFKSREDLNEEGFFRTGTGAKTTAKVKKLEGADITRNIWENIDKQYATMIAAAYENQTRRVSVEQMRSIDPSLAEITNPSDPRVNLRYRDGGKDVNVVIENPNDLAAFQSMTYQLSPIMKAFGGFTKVLRAGALLNPMFWIRQLIRDPISATLTGQAGIVTPFHSAKEFLSVITRNSEEAKILASRGVIGQFDSTVTLQEYLGNVGKDKQQSPGMIQRGLHRLLEIHEASDAATRIAIYKKAKDKALKDGMSESQAVDYAVFKARESINFALTGNSPTLANLRQMIPFLNATIVGLDTLYRAATGYGLNPEEKAKVQRMFAARAMMMVAMTVAYAASLQDDDDYKKLPDYVKDGNWLIPMSTESGKQFVKVTVPYEVGFLFKTLPEVFIRYMAGTSTGKEALASIRSGFIQNMPTGGVPVPQAVRPLLEVVTNHSFFTNRPIEGMGDSRLPVAERGQRASEFAKMMSGLGLDKFSLSPAKIDVLTKGYFAELGSFFTSLADAVIATSTGKEPTPKNLNNAFSRAFLTDPTVNKAVSDFYEIERSAQETANLFNDMKKQGRGEELRALLADPEKRMQVGISSTLNRIQKNMSDINAAIRIIDRNQSIPPQERRQKINELQAVLGRLAQRGVEMAGIAGLTR